MSRDCCLRKPQEQRRREERCEKLSDINRIRKTVNNWMELNKMIHRRSTVGFKAFAFLSLMIFFIFLFHTFRFHIGRRVTRLTADRGASMDSQESLKRSASVKSNEEAFSLTKPMMRNKICVNFSALFYLSVYFSLARYQTNERMNRSQKTVRKQQQILWIKFPFICLLRSSWSEFLMSFSHSRLRSLIARSSSVFFFLIFFGWAKREEAQMDH